MIIILDTDIDQGIEHVVIVDTDSTFDTPETETSYSTEEQLDTGFLFAAIQGLRGARDTLTSESLGQPIISTLGILGYTLAFGFFQFWPLFLYFLSSSEAISSSYSFYVLPIILLSMVLSPLFIIYFLKTKNKKWHLRRLSYVDIVTLLFLLLNLISFLLCSLLVLPYFIDQVRYIIDNIGIMSEYFEYVKYH